MAKGDTKSSRSSWGGGGGYSYSYDDEGRGASKNYWEAFEKRFASSGFSSDWLTGVTESISFLPLDDKFLYNCVHNMTERYTLHDWAWRKFEDSDTNDGRVRRIVIKHCGLEHWKLLQTRARRVWEETQEEIRRRNQERSDEHEANYKAAFEARKIKREEEVRQLMHNTDAVVGMLRTEFDTAFDYQEVYGRREGEWIDDPVSLYHDGRGYGYEESKAVGTKLQITVSLDLSNSMYYNRVAIDAANAFRDTYLALEQLQAEHQSDLFIGAFTFSEDGYQSGETGRIARCISVGWNGQQRVVSEDGLGAVEDYRPTNVDSWYGKGVFTGEDTWMYPLFEEIEQWEQKYSDPGAIRLDLVITDAVVEHATDIRRSDVIQERRDGTLNTIMLNFMPIEDWADSDLPLRCIQYPVSPGNISGMLRSIITEFAAAYM